MFGTDDLPGLTPGLLVTDEFGWEPASTLIDGTHLPRVLAEAAHRWGGTPHACAALAWKSYSYYAALPAILGWAAARRVPLLDPADVLITFADPRPLVTLGLRASTPVAVLPTDPLAGLPGTRVVADESELLAVLRSTLLDAHFHPMITAFQREARVGTRTLLGSVASSTAHALLQAADALPGPTTRSVDTLLDALDLADLVEVVPDASGRPTVQRRTCCLAFTLPRPKVCQGCCVRS
ncbi:ferric iron reductase [Micromonospora sp. NPDC000207]|uniref:ferric iron reductase n=1 Tax=Micromonospora sp. NPDC000207 TaxID=3154246 RepID=UPI00331B9848